VNVKGDCIIPPNSFALARTVEYLRIPRNVLTVCLGKCVTGDTRVVDAETGDYLPISEFAGRGRTIGLDGWRLAPLGVSDFIPQGVKPVFRMTTRTGLQIRATANHPFRQLQGWTALSELRPGDRIAVAREVPIFGNTPLPEWEATLLGLMISEGQCYTPGHSPVFSNEDPALIAAFERTVRDGLGGRAVDRGGEMETDRAAVWLASHGMRTKSAEKSVPSAVFRAPRESVVEFLRALLSADGSISGDADATLLEYSAGSRRLVEDVHHLLLRFGIVSLIRHEATQVETTAFRVQITDRRMIRRFAEQIGFLAGSQKQATLETFLPALAQGRVKFHFDTLPKEALAVMTEAAYGAGRTLSSLGIRSTSPSQSLSLATATLVADATRDETLVALSSDTGPLWDVVVSIEPAGEEEVFDLTVPGAENFLANGIVCHNSTYARCGLIVNVTPFEPEWQGHATLEISNTTPLPARIYANEGLCQVLFFESDEPCETSYADKKGKYQAQGPEIVLPRM
jgi:hypothetical protein